MRLGRRIRGGLESVGGLALNVGQNEKRRLFKLLGLALAGGGLGVALPLRQAVAPEALAIPSMATQWVHGHGLLVGEPEKVESDAAAGPSRRIRGLSYSRNQFHFVIPTPPLPQGGRLLVASALVRFKTQAGAVITGLHLFDGECSVAEVGGLELRSSDWTEHRIVFDPLVEIRRGLSLSLQAAFDAVDRELEIGALGCEMQMAGALA
jgi:hypothetical protein